MFPNFDFETVVKETKKDIEFKQRAELGRVPKMIFKNGKAYVEVENGKVILCSNDREKVGVYVQMLLRTKKDKYKVYKGTGFGMSYFEHRGNGALPESFICSEIERELSQQLSKLPVFDKMVDFGWEKKIDTLEVSFTIVLKYGDTIKVSEVI